MIETFEAVIFGLSAGAWSIVDRHPVGEVSEGLEWVRRRLMTPTGYERLSGRVLSTSDGETAEAIVRKLSKYAGSGIAPQCYHHKHRARVKAQRPVEA
jgi:hypothetical protein